MSITRISKTAFDPEVPRKYLTDRKWLLLLRAKQKLIYVRLCTLKFELNIFGLQYFPFTSYGIRDDLWEIINRPIWPNIKVEEIYWRQPCITSVHPKTILVDFINSPSSMCHSKFESQHFFTWTSTSTFKIMK